MPNPIARVRSTRSGSAAAWEVCLAAVLVLLSGCDQLASLNGLRTQYVALRYISEAQDLSLRHPLDRPRVAHCLDRALALSPDDRIILPKAIGLYIGIEDYQAALRAIGRFSAATGAPMLLERGQCLLMTGYKAEGRELIYRALRDARAQWLAHGVNPAAYALTLNNAGYTLADAGVDLEQARKMIEQAVQLAPLEASFTDSLGWVLYRAGDLQRAAFYMERAARLAAARPDPTVYYHLGAVYAAQGKRFWAERSLKRVLDIDPYNKPARDTLQKLRYELPQPGRV